jgi:hypothetical protein
MRVSNDERSQVADVLSKHYAEGRLDDTEFKERLDRAMGAKTRADLSGLTTDLPRTGPPSDAPARGRRPVLAVLVAVAVVLAVAWSTWAVPHVPWFVVGLIVLFFFTRGRWRHTHHHEHVVEGRPW